MPLDRPPNQARDQHAAPALAIRATPSLPAQLRGVVPDCAKQCLTTYIDEEYSCPGNGFTCLCQNYSTEGFTLGELAYICLHQNCKQADSTESSDLYGICDTQAKAVQPTLTVLTPPATTATASHKASTSKKTRQALSTTALSTPTSSSKSALSSKSHQTLTGPFSTAMAPPSTTKTSGPSAEPVAASSSPVTHATKLSGPQAAGIAVAVIGAVALLIAATVLFICLRRRKRTYEPEQKSLDSAKESISRLSPVMPSFSQPPRKLPQQAPDEMRRVDRDTLRCWQLLATQPTQRNDAPIDATFESGESHNGTRAVSQLLPNQPRQAPIQQPIPTRSPSDDTTTTVFEEEDIPPVPTIPSFDGYGLPPNPRAKQSLPTLRSQQSTPSPTPKKLSLPSIRPPSLSLDVPRSAKRTPQIPAQSPAAYPRSPMRASFATALSPAAYPKSPLRSPWALASPMGFPPLPVVEEEESVPEQPARTPLRSQSRDSSVSLLNYYASPDAGVVVSPVSATADTPAPLEIVNKKRKAAPSALTVTKPSALSQAVRRDSGASDTSFESTDADEPTPPDEDERQLTPVQESPILESSPIAEIRYPRIPRSANQTVPRSPAHGTPSPYRPNSTIDLKSPKAPLAARKISPIPPDAEEEWPLKSPVTPVRPINTTSSLSGSTLAAKRRGSSTAHSLELRLEIPDTAYSPYKRSDLPSQKQANNTLSHESPLKGYGRVANSGQRMSRSQVKSNKANPQQPRPRKPAKKHDDWEPTLTPDKRGDDLYLHFGLTTPKQVQFMI